MGSEGEGLSTGFACLGKRTQRVDRAGAQSEQFQKIVEIERTLLFDPERASGVAGIRYGYGSFGPHPGDPVTDRLFAFPGSMAAAQRSHSPDECRETSPGRDGPVQVGQLQVTVGIYRSGNQNAAVELHARQRIHPVTGYDLRDTAVGVNGQNPVFQEAMGRVEIVCCYPAQAPSTLFHRPSVCSLSAGG